MKRSLMLTLLSLLALAAVAQSGNYVFDKKISLPGDGGYDYLTIDQVHHRLYVSHGSSVNIIDLDTQQPVGTIDSLQGVHGIAIDDELNRGFISDGRANAVTVFDLNTLKSITVIHLTGKNPDAITYDPSSKKIFAFNGGSSNASVIDPQTMKETSLINLGGAPEFAVADGKGRLYNNLEDKNAMVVIDTKTMKPLHTYALSPCGAPTGLALDPANNRAFSVCRENKGMSVVDLSSGKVITTVPIGAGVDAVAYDPVSKLILSSNGEGNVTIIKQETPDTYQVVQTLPTQVRARTMALDPATHNIYLSVATFDPNTRRPVSGTFAVLVYKMQ